MKNISMKLKMTYLCALLLFLFIIISTFEGVHGRRSVSCLKPLLADLKQNARVYDCVDFYKQPAFDHPALKNLVPTVRSNSTTSTQGRFNISKGGCPDGTVPILRTNQGGFPPVRPRAKEYCHATVHTNTPDRKFYGSSAKLSLNKPQAQGNQWSSSRIKLFNGPESIEAGWMVSPSDFGDNEAYLYVKYKAGPNWCLNLNCPGFVQVAQDIPLGSTTPRTYSVIGGQQFMWGISIDKHSDDGNWWLSVTLDTSIRQIGYWPSSLFTSLKDAANMVEWGGEITDPGAVEPAPAMGNGWKAYYNQCNCAFLQEVTVIDESHNKVIPYGTQKSANCQALYTVLDWAAHGTPNGRIMLFGGSQLL